MGGNQTNPNIEKLPAYVESVMFFTGNSHTANAQPFASGSFPPSAALTSSGLLGAITTGNPAACTQTFAVDVTFVNSSAWHSVSIYAVDANSYGRVQAIEVYDLATKNTISPWQTMRDFEKGSFWTWSYNKSIRIRIAYVRATVDAAGAVLSGVFF